MDTGLNTNFVSLTCSSARISSDALRQQSEELLDLKLKLADVEVICVASEGCVLVTKALICAIIYRNNLSMDNLHYRLIFYLDKSRRENEIPGKNLLKDVKFQNLVEKCCNARKI